MAADDSVDVVERFGAAWAAHDLDAALGMQRWRYEWDGGHVRGVDVFRVRDGKVAEKLSYVKG